MARVQGGLSPQPHRPSAPHESVVRRSHVVHATPPTPHAAAVADRQTPSEQQPWQLSQPDMGAASTTVTGRSTPRTTPTRARPSPTTSPADRPSTQISNVSPSSASGSSTRTDELLASSSPAVSGRALGPNTPASPNVPL
jgi:hypothetical protein